MDEQDIYKFLDEIELKTVEVLEKDSLELEKIERIKQKTKLKLRLNEESCQIKVVDFRLKGSSIKLNVKIIAAVIVLAFILPFSVSALNGVYKFVPGLGAVVETDNQLYDSNEQLQIETSLGIASLESFIYVDQEYASTKINLAFPKGYYAPTEEIQKQPILKEATLIMDGERISSSTGICNWGQTLICSHEFNDLPNFSEVEEIYYEFILFDDTVYQFDVSLQVVEGEASISEIGPTDTKYDIMITARTKEENGVLDVNFIPQTQKGEILDYIYLSYFDSYQNITLTDSNGTIVKGEQIFHTDRANHFKFEIKDLVKPFVINVNSVMMNIDLRDKALTYSLNLPNINETLNEVPPIEVNGFSIPIKEVTLTDTKNRDFPILLDKAVGALTIKFDLPEEWIEGGRLTHLYLDDDYLPDNEDSVSPYFASYSSSVEPFWKRGEFNIGLKEIPEQLKLYLTSYDVEVQGSWEFIVD